MDNASQIHAPVTMDGQGTSVIYSSLVDECKTDNCKFPNGHCDGNTCIRAFVLTGFSGLACRDFACVDSLCLKDGKGNGNNKCVNCSPGYSGINILCETEK